MNQNEIIKNTEYYILENEYLKIKVMNLGAALVSFYEKQTQTDIVLGFDHVKGYLDHSSAYLGATVGRCANRIGKGEFILHGKVYHSSVNDGPNSLHGGIDNFSFKLFKAYQEKNVVVFTYESKDMEEGYPGNLQLTVEYRLHGRELDYVIKGISDQDTLFNITNHSYFNLNGQGDILSHQLKIYSDKVAMVDENGLTEDKWIDTENTAFDFHDFRNISEQLKLKHPNIETAHGYDHNYLFENLNMKKMAELRNDRLMLSISSDLPGMHLYSGNYLNFTGRNNEAYTDKSGICFECQYYPNAINYSDYIKPILKAHHQQEHRIQYTLTERKTYEY